MITQEKLIDGTVIVIDDIISDLEMIRRNILLILDVDDVDEGEDTNLLEYVADTADEIGFSVQQKQVALAYPRQFVAAYDKMKKRIDIEIPAAYVFSELKRRITN